MAGPPPGAYNQRMRAWLTVVVSLGIWLAAPEARAQAPIAPPAQAPPAQALTAADVLAEVQRFYGAHPEVDAKVRLIATTAGRRTTIDGRLEVTDGRLRWRQFARPPRASRKQGAIVAREIIGDGAQLVAFDHVNHQIRVAPPDARLLPIALAHVYDRAALANLTPAVASRGGHGATAELVLTLTPPAGASFASLALVVAFDNHRVRQAVVTDLAGDTVDVRFYEPRYDRPVGTVATWRLALQPQVARYTVIVPPVLGSPPAPATP